MSKKEGLTGFEQIALDAGKSTRAFDEMPGDPLDLAREELEKLALEAITENDVTLLAAVRAELSRLAGAR